MNASTCRLNHSCNTVEKRGFAGTTASHNTEKLSRHDLKSDSVQCSRLVWQRPIDFGKIFNIQNWFHVNASYPFLGK